MSTSYEDDYHNHAIFYADVDWSNKNDKYAANVGNYDSMTYYNDAMDYYHNFDARYDPDESFTDTNGNGTWDQGEIFFDNNDNGIRDKYSWEWSNRDERLRYDRWRHKSSKYAEVNNFIIAGFLLNRIISVIDVFILENRGNLSSELIHHNDNSMNFKIYYSFSIL